MRKENRNKRIISKIKHGLFIYGFTNWLARRGIEIRPYYWEKEFVEKCNPPQIKGNPTEFSIKYLNADDIRYICSSGMGYNVNEKLENLKKGQLCVALMQDEKYVAYSWIELNQIDFRKRSMELKKNESYLGGMHTVEAYRGKNLATYLRFKIYGILDELGIDTIYSISDYFNYPAIKFKKKLNSKHMNLFLHIGFFNKIEWNFKLRNYSRIDDRKSSNQLV